MPLVIDGLFPRPQSGDRLIVEGVQKVRPGVPVKIVTPEQKQKVILPVRNPVQPKTSKAK